MLSFIPVIGIVRACGQIKLTFIPCGRIVASRSYAELSRIPGACVVSANRAINSAVISKIVIQRSESLTEELSRKRAGRILTDIRERRNRSD